MASALHPRHVMMEEELHKRASGRLVRRRLVRGRLVRGRPGDGAGQTQRTRWRSPRRVWRIYPLRRALLRPPSPQHPLRVLWSQAGIWWSLDPMDLRRILWS